MTVAEAHPDKTGKMRDIVKELAGGEAAAVDVVFVVPEHRFGTFSVQAIKDCPPNVHQYVMKVDPPAASVGPAPSSGVAPSSRKRQKKS
jgi:hypothetical protein